MAETCEGCGDEASELCPDFRCRRCHVSLSFSDCCDGTWSVDMLRGRHSDDELRKLYPSAKQWATTSEGSGNV
jgi:hypothetical protein